MLIRITPKEQLDLRMLRMVTSTGAVLPAEVYDWFYDVAFPRGAQLVSMSGGTDIAGCCTYMSRLYTTLGNSTDYERTVVAGTPLLPVYRGEIQVKALGMAVDIFDIAKAGHVSVEEMGSAGELVCTKPFPSQPIAFYGTGGRELYRSSYFERFGVHVWCQSDYVQRVNATGGILMLGRS